MVRRHSFRFPSFHRIAVQRSTTGRHGAARLEGAGWSDGTRATAARGALRDERVRRNKGRKKKNCGWASTSTGFSQDATRRDVVAGQATLGQGYLGDGAEVMRDRAAIEAGCAVLERAAGAGWTAGVAGRARAPWIAVASGMDV